MATPNIVPRADSEGGLGTASKYWASAYIDAITTTGVITAGGGINVTGSDNTTSTLKLTNTAPSPDNSWSLVPQYNSQDLKLLEDSTARITFSSGGGVGILTGALSISGDGSNAATLTESSGGDFTIASIDDLRLEAGGNDIVLRGASSAEFGRLSNDSQNFIIQNLTSDKDIMFKVNDGGVATEIARFDGSRGSMLFSDSQNLEFGDTPALQLYHNGSHSLISNQVGTLFIRNQTVDGDILLQADDGAGTATTYLTLDGSDPALLVAKKMIFSDNTYLYVGGGADLQIVHNGTDSQVTNTTGNLQFTNTADDKDISFASDNGAGGDAIYFYLDGSSATYADGATTSLYTNWPDKSIISLGTSHDLQIYHDGSNSYIREAGTGNLFIEASDNIYFRNAAQTEYYGQFIHNGGVHFYHNNVKKFETTAAGVTVTGDVTSSGQLKSIGADTSTGATVSSALGMFLQNTSDTDGNFIPIDFYNSSGYVTARIGAQFDDAGDRNTDLYFCTRANSGALTEHMRIDEGGSTTLTGSGSSTRFQVTGDVQVLGATDFHIPAARKLCLDGGGDTYLIESAANTFKVFTGGTEALEIDGSQEATFAGKVGIGATASDFHADADDLVVGGGSGNTGLTIHSGTAGYGSIFFADGTADDATEKRGQIRYLQGTERMDFHTDNVTTAALSLAAAGDATFAGNLSIPAYIYHEGDANTYIGFSADDTFRVATNNTNRFIVNNSTTTINADTFNIVSSADTDPLINIQSIGNNTNGARLRFTVDRAAAPADSDDIGIIEFVGEDAGQNATTYGQILGEIHETAEGDEAGRITMNVANDNVLRPGLKLEALKGTSAQVDVTIGNGAGSVTTTAGDLTVTGDVVMMANLPTSDPSNAGQLWANSGVVTVSAG